LSPLPITKDLSPATCLALRMAVRLAFPSALSYLRHNKTLADTKGMFIAI
jgi:hypothetical protein